VGELLKGLGSQLVIDLSSESKIALCNVFSTFGGTFDDLLVYTIKKKGNRRTGIFDFVVRKGVTRS
jgi:hypothetical protein